MDTSEVTFQETVEWASMKSEETPVQSSRFPIFYMIIGGVVILILTIFIIYLARRDPKTKDALEMMKDEDYEDDEYSYEDVLDDNNNDDNQQSGSYDE